MSRKSRVVLVPMLFFFALGVLVVECRHRQDSSEVVHRHRHRHEPSSLWHHKYPPRSSSSSSSWSENENEDYEDVEDESEEDYGLDPYDRSYSAKTAHRGRLDSRHSRPYYRSIHHGIKYAERHRNSRYGGARERNHRIRPSRDRTYRKGHSLDYDDEEEVDYYNDYDKYNRYGDDKDDLNESEEYYNRRNVRKHRLDDYESQDSKDQRAYQDSRRDWKPKNSIRKDERRDRRRKFGTSYRGVSKNRFHEDSEEDDDDVELTGNNRKKVFKENGTGSFDYDDDLDDFFDEEENDDNEETRSSKDYEKEEESGNDESDELDNDFYKNDVKPPLRTYDDIIRRLTSEDPATPKTTVRRDYRNIEIGKYLKRDAYGNLKYEPKNLSRSDLDPVTMTSFAATTAKSLIDKMETNPQKVSIVVEFSDNKKNVGNKKKVIPEVVGAQVKTKSLDQEYDYADNEQEDDPSAQAESNNADYGEDDNEEEESIMSPTTTTTSTTAPTTTTTTTTTTPKPFFDVRFHHKHLTTYGGSTGAQYNAYQPKNDYPAMSAHSMHKWQSLGTRESVKETRDKYPEFRNNGKSAEAKEAIQHALKVSREGSCRWPRARVVPVRDVYPSTTTTYVPHCAILHRCSDDTGCCKLESYTCVPKQSHRVELYFHTTNVEGGSVVEKLTFYNHTECECRERDEFQTKNEKLAEARVARQHTPLFPPQTLRRPPPRKPCRCPSEFTPKITPGGECQCKCSDNDQNCIKTRRGKVYFSIADRLCIQNGDCSTPLCEFGDYMRRQGKCPRKQDQFGRFPNHQTNLHHGFRS